MASSADYEHVFLLLYANVTGQALAVALDLEIADKIDAGLTEPAELARDLGADPLNLTRLLRALVALGLCTEDADGRFGLTASGELLRTTDPNSLADLAKLTTAHIGDLVGWREMKSSVLTGKCAFEERNGTDFFGYLTAHPELYRSLNLAMRGGSRLIGKEVAESYDFPRGAAVTDIGGGDGTLLANVLAAHPDMTGTVYDTPAGVEQARATLDEVGVADRCTVTAGDFFENVPAGSDVYLIKSVLHDWDDESSRRILVNCRRAIPDHGRLIILEPLLDDSAAASGSVYSRLSDLNMMTALGGRERSRADFEKLCADSGFDVVGARRLERFDIAVIEAVPVVAGDAR
ncbi:acetylserotonin O-methyltransferase [Saccharothrix sp. S26]|uniref:acetylserotonin O-methyltransferase n=1 Tax=Saccharothrix sp. S26 TaxID=2907215 RepID=UPI001F4441F5|nr:acetylserotonin O-methyltransferase [Saccharothrix sp. S26]MCE6995347.1 acetylserotonin O-methyltransferase [Saccharothrix sp. S26]